MSRPRLQLVFAQVLAGALASACGGSTASSTGVIVGDGGGADGGVGADGALPPDDSIFRNFDTTVCLSPTELAFRFPRNASLAPGVDYLGAFATDDPPGSGLRATGLDVGLACATATDRAACQASLFRPQSPSAGWNICEPNCGGDLAGIMHVRTTGGDAVTVITTPDRVRSAFLPIDLAREAVSVAAQVYSGTISCTENSVRRDTDGSFLVKLTRAGCEPSSPRTSVDYTDEYVVRVRADGSTIVVAQRRIKQTDTPGCAVAGRRPEGLQRSARASCIDESSLRTAGGAYFAQMAHLEAASVSAFAQLADELRAHGAPPQLIARAERAIADEQRHARVVGALAEARGHRPPGVSVPPPRGRTLVEIATENRVEGCVRETFGALLATYQARFAADPEVRAALRDIADDETEHASLSWDLDAWLGAQLSAAELASIEEAEGRALAELARECDRALDEETRRATGLPSRTLAATLLDGLAGQLGLRAA